MIKDAMDLKRDNNILLDMHRTERWNAFSEQQRVSMVHFRYKRRKRRRKYPAICIHCIG